MTVVFKYQFIKRCYSSLTLALALETVTLRVPSGQSKGGNWPKSSFWGVSINKNCPSYLSSWSKKKFQNFSFNCLNPLAPKSTQVINGLCVPVARAGSIRSAPFCLTGVWEPSLDLTKPANTFLLPSSGSYAISFKPYSLTTDHS